MILGVISAIDSTKGVTVKVDGESATSTKKYSYLGSYVPTVGDKILIEEISGSYVILGKLVTKVADSGNVRHADNATSADTALECTGTAASANYATSAGSANSAMKCTGTAAYSGKAEQAIECTGTAARSIICTGTAERAKTAAVATVANGLSNSYGSVNGALVTGVTKDFTTGYVTDVQITFNHSFVTKGI